MFSRIEKIAEKKFVGKNSTMSLANNRTRELWKSFMPHRNKIQNSIGHEFYSIQIYDPEFFYHFDVNREYKKWACREVENFGNIPDSLDTIVIESVLYAVFIHRGTAETAPLTFKYIFETWLPDSNYTLDNRPHLEVLGEKYKNDDPASEEEFWIPIK